jgi:hypothetical protein
MTSTQANKPNKSAPAQQYTSHAGLTPCVQELVYSKKIDFSKGHERFRGKQKIGTGPGRKEFQFPPPGYKKKRQVKTTKWGV